MHQVVAFFLVTLPWLNPFAPGPSPAVGPWLFSAGCITTLFGLAVGYRFNDGSLGFLKPIAFAWLAAGLISCAIALPQYFGAADPLNPWVNQAQLGEAFANLRQRNQFATLTNIALAALLYVAVRSRRTPLAERTGHAALILAAASLLVIGNAVSSSRTGLFQLLLICGVCALWGALCSLAVQRLLLCAVLVYCISMFAAPWLAGLDAASHGAFARLGNDEVCSSRLTLWSNVLHLVAQKPWLGWGWGELDYAHFITIYDGPRFCDILDNAHNLPLHLAVELGVPFALLVCGGFAGWVVKQKPWAERNSVRQMAWAVLAVILLHSMLEYPLWYGPFQVAFALCLVMLHSRPATAVDSEDSTKNASNMPLDHSNIAHAAMVIVASLVGLAAIFYAAWDYHRVSQIYLQPESRHAAYQNDTLAHAKKSWLFADQALFAEVILTPLTPANADWVYASSAKLLHYSPEPRVVEKLVESAVMLGYDDEALAYLARFKAAFPKEHAARAIFNRKPVNY